MKIDLIVLVFILTPFFGIAQDSQVIVEADADQNSTRELVVAKNINSTSSGLTNIQLISGAGSDESYGSILTYNMNYTAIPDFNGYLSILSGGNTLEGRGINFIGQNSYANIRFYLGGYQSSDLKMILSSQGNLGIGTSSPSSKLQVSDGDIYLENIDRGVIMKSPNGKCWLMTIDNTGNVITSAVVCP